jgi:hypothetical protein
MGDGSLENGRAKNEAPRVAFQGRRWSLREFAGGGGICLRESMGPGVGDLTILEKRGRENGNNIPADDSVGAG